MNQNVPQPSFELPSVPAEQNPPIAPDANGESSMSQPEKYLAPPKASGSVQAVASQQSGQPLPQAPQPINPASAQQTTVSPVAADDADLIEKEWVVKAKQIVSANREDPYAQTKEMSKFKADYLKKRYNKDLKVEDS